MKKKIFSGKQISLWVAAAVSLGALFSNNRFADANAQERLWSTVTSGHQRVAQEAKMDARVWKSASAEESPTAVGEGFKMLDLSGKVVDFESLKGKVVFLNIWATWCPPCVAEMPNIQRLYEKVGSDKIAFVMLSVDEDGINKVKKFVARKGFTFPVYLPASELPAEFYTQSIPTTFIISPQGKIVARQEGMAEYDTPEVQEFLQKLAK